MRSQVALRPGGAFAPRRWRRSEAGELVGLAEDAGAALEGHEVARHHLHGAVVAMAVEQHAASPRAGAGRLGALHDIAIEERKVLLGAGVRAQPDQLGAEELSAAAG